MCASVADMLGERITGVRILVIGLLSSSERSIGIVAGGCILAMAWSCIGNRLVASGGWLLRSMMVGSPPCLVVGLWGPWLM